MMPMVAMNNGDAETSRSVSESKCTTCINGCTCCFIFSFNLDNCSRKYENLGTWKLGNNVICEAIIGLLKYLLYERGQTPYMFDTMAAVGYRNKVQGLTTTSLDDIRQRQEDKKESAFVLSFGQLFTNLRNLFNERNLSGSHLSRQHIRRVALIFGSTPMTPKEIHYIEIRQDDHYQPVPSSTNDVVQAMLRSLISTSRDTKFPKCPSSTNATVMLEISCPEMPKITWFVSAYSPLSKVNKRVNRFTYRLTCSATKPNSIADISKVSKDFNSRPVNIYESPVPIQMFSEKQQTRSKSGVLRESEDTRASNEEVFGWFQMPNIVKGLNVSR